jgi:hypothetical protein
MHHGAGFSHTFIVNDLSNLEFGCKDNASCENFPASYDYKSLLCQFKLVRYENFTPAYGIIKAAYYFSCGYFARSFGVLGISITFAPENEPPI